MLLLCGLFVCNVNKAVLAIAVNGVDGGAVFAVYTAVFATIRASAM